MQALGGDQQGQAQAATAGFKYDPTSGNTGLSSALYTTSKAARVEADTLTVAS